MEASSREAVKYSTRIRIFRKTLLEECLLVAEVLNEHDRYRSICESIRGAWRFFEDGERGASLGRRREGRDALCQQIVSECLDQPVCLCEDVCTSVYRNEVYRMIRNGLRSVVEEAVREVEALHKVLRRLHQGVSAEQHDASSPRQNISSSVDNNADKDCDDVLPETPGQEIWRPLSMEESTATTKKEEDDHDHQQQQDDDDDFDDRIASQDDNDDARMHVEITHIVDEYFRLRYLVVHLVDLGGGHSSDEELKHFFASK